MSSVSSVHLLLSSVVAGGPAGSDYKQRQGLQALQVMHLPVEQGNLAMYDLQCLLPEPAINFDQIDTNGDGVITRAEWATAIGLGPPVDPGHGFTDRRQGSSNEVLYVSGFIDLTYEFLILRTLLLACNILCGCTVPIMNVSNNCD